MSKCKCLHQLASELGDLLVRGAHRRDNELSEITSSSAGQEIAPVATYITTTRYTANRGSQAAATSGS